MANDPTLDSLDELVRLIMDKASDLAVLAGLNKVIDARTINSRIEGSSEGQEDCQVT